MLMYSCIFVYSCIIVTFTIFLFSINAMKQVIVVLFNRCFYLENMLFQRMQNTEIEINVYEVIECYTTNPKYSKFPASSL